MSEAEFPLPHPESAPARPGKPAATRSLPAPVFHDARHHLKIYQADCLDVLAAIPEGSVDLIFADPPYFLSNDGITCHAGRMVSVNKGRFQAAAQLYSSSLRC